MYRFLLFLILGWLLGQSAQAQTLPAPGGASDANALPGAVLDYQTKPWYQPKPEPIRPSIEPSNRTPKRDIEEELEPVELEVPQPAAVPENALKVLIRDIQLDGVTLLSERQLQPILAQYENQELTFTDIENLIGELNQLYVNAGYINSQIYLPPQDFQNNTLVLKALEVEVGQLRFEDSSYFSSLAVLPRIAVKPGDYLNVQELSRSIRFINDNPDLNISAVLEKGSEPGTSNILLKQQSEFPVHTTLFWDNLGRSSIGNYRYGLTLNHNNFLGFGDRLYSTVHFNRHAFGVDNQYLFPIGAYGTQLGFNYFYSKLKLGGALKPLNIGSNAHIFSPAIYQPLIKNKHAGLDLSLALDFKNLNTTLDGERLFADRLRVLRPGLNGYVIDRWGRTIFNQEVGFGLPLFGASTGDSKFASKPGSGSRFLTLTGGVSRVQKLPWDMMGILRGRYQYSPDRLVSAEQFQAGGAYTVRGYEEGRLLGDSGYTLNAEWYIPALFIPKDVTVFKRKQPLRQIIHAVGFIDFAQIFTRHPRGNELSRGKLFSWGVGLRVQLTKSLIARLDLGFPLIRGETSDKVNQARLHFGLQSTLF